MPVVGSESVDEGEVAPGIDAVVASHSMAMTQTLDVRKGRWHAIDSAS